MSATGTTALITTGFASVGTAMLAILGVFLGIAVAYLIFKFGWRRTKGVVR